MVRPVRKITDAPEIEIPASVRLGTRTVPLRAP